jgi:hypothetical protein
MSRFETAGHLVSWAGLCPSNDESAGKRRSNRMKKGTIAEGHSSPMCLGGGAHQGHLLPRPIPPPAQPPRPQKAIGAVAASMLTTAYHMLKNGTLYEDLGVNHFDNRAKDKQALRLINRLKHLGFTVQITPFAA